VVNILASLVCSFHIYTCIKTSHSIPENTHDYYLPIFKKGNKKGKLEDLLMGKGEGGGKQEVSK
jgi:hypothetical protein